jgi:hypothetical protein
MWVKVTLWLAREPIANIAADEVIVKESQINLPTKLALQAFLLFESNTKIA